MTDLSRAQVNNAKVRRRCNAAVMGDEPQRMLNNSLRLPSVSQLRKIQGGALRTLMFRRFIHAIYLHGHFWLCKKGYVSFVDEKTPFEFCLHVLDRRGGLPKLQQA